MKPLEAAEKLALARTLIMRAEPLPPSLRCWLCGAFDHRLADPSQTLDKRLGLSSRAGGRLHAASKIPALHAAIRALAAGVAPVSKRAAALCERLQKHRTQPEPEISEIERKFGRIPRSHRQLVNIIAGKSVASKPGNLKTVDVAIFGDIGSSGHENRSPPATD